MRAQVTNELAAKQNVDAALIIILQAFAFSDMRL